MRGCRCIHRVLAHLGGSSNSRASRHSEPLRHGPLGGAGVRSVTNLTLRHRERERETSVIIRCVQLSTPGQAVANMICKQPPFPPGLIHRTNYSGICSEPCTRRCGCQRRLRRKATSPGTSEHGSIGSFSNRTHGACRTYLPCPGLWSSFHQQRSVGRCGRSGV